MLSFSNKLLSGVVNILILILQESEETSKKSNFEIKILQGISF